MSRARQQLILVGDFEYFRTAAELLVEYRQIAGHDPGEADPPVFWKTLQAAFAPFDRSIHATAEGQEQPVIVPAGMILEAGK
jgi:hypothetical protein